MADESGERLTFFRGTVAPLALLVVAPPSALLLWVAVAYHGGSIAALVGAIRAGQVWRELPAPSLFATAVIAAWSVLAWALLRFLPGETHEGPATPSGRRPRYRKNGLSAWLVTHGLLVLGFATGLLSARRFVDHYGEILSTLNLFALGMCLALRIAAARRPPRGDLVVTNNPIFDFFQGVELHPRSFGVQLKQLVNCRISMMGWSAIALTLCFYQIERDGHLSAALAVSALLVMVYLFKFFVWETGYFASLDITHDRFGFYIGWGVLVWVPAVYPIAQLQIAIASPRVGWAAAAVIGALGLAAILLNYAADAQRQRVRATHGKTLVWGRPPLLIEATYRTGDGASRKNVLLASGYWGLARHFHYLPELAVALCWTLPAGRSGAVAYFYVVFLAILLVDRAGRDDKRCASKYGTAWGEYRRLVPFRIVPGLY